MVLNMLRQNKIVMLVVMFLVIGLAVWLLETFFGYSQFERFVTPEQTALLCNEPESNECRKTIQKMFE